MVVVVPQGDFDALHGQLEPLQQGNWEDMAYAMFEHDIAMMMNDLYDGDKWYMMILEDFSKIY